MSGNPPVLDFVELVLACAQAGLTFSKDAYDRDRYHRLQAAATGLLASRAGVHDADVARWLALDQHYPTPKIDVRAMLLDADARVLLVRERSDRGWTLPGGWCDVGQSPGDAVRSEVREEAGLDVEPVRLLALLDKRKHAHPPQMPHACKAFFLCRVLGGSLLQDTPETCGAAYFDVHDLPALSLDRVLAAQIRGLHARVQAGLSEALFD